MNKPFFQFDKFLSETSGNKMKMVVEKFILYRANIPIYL